MSRPFHVHTDVRRRFDDLALAIERAPAAPFTAPADVGGSGPGERAVVVRLQAHLAGVPVERDVHLEVDEPRRRATREIVLPVRWHAVDHARAFPRADGVLEVQALSDHPPVSQLILVGTYQPPLGVLGDAVDHLGGADVAAETVQQLLERVVAWARSLHPRTDAPVQP